MPDLKSILQRAETIAVVGCSDNPDRISYTIARYLLNAGYRVIPVNPSYDEAVGQRCYPDLQNIPREVTVDLVNIFRRPEHTARMVEMAVARAEETGTRPVIWTQLGVSSPEARQRAEEAGLLYVQNECIMVVHRRRLGA